MKLKSAGDMMKLAKELERHVNNMLLAQAMAELKREAVDKIERQVLAENNYEYDTEKWKSLEVSGRITEPKETYLMRDDHFLDYCAKVSAIHLANGFEDAAKGYCPALVLEHLLTQAQNLVLDVGSEGVGVDLSAGDWETRNKALELLTKIVVNRPGYRAPKIPKVA